MSFLWPSMLIFLVILPLLALLYQRLQQRRRRLAAGFGSSGFAVINPTRRRAIGRHIPALLFFGGLVVLVLALARPETTVKLPSVEGTAILVFDVSHSMAATDVQPSRMEVLKATAREFVTRQPPTVKIGIVSFSSNGFAVQTPTNEQAALLGAIDRLQPQVGTSLGQGIMSALSAIIVDAGMEPHAGPGSPPPAQPLAPPDMGGQLPLTGAPGEELAKGSFPSSIIVLFSDGENTDDPDPLPAVQAAKDRAVRIYTVGIGSTAGTTLTIDGFNVFTRLDEKTLQQIAQLTGGAYYNAGKEQDLQSIYGNIRPQIAIKDQQMEVTSLFAGASLLAMLVGGMFSLVWFNRLL